MCPTHPPAHCMYFQQSASEPRCITAPLFPLHLDEHILHRGGSDRCYFSCTFMFRNTRDFFCHGSLQHLSLWTSNPVDGWLQSYWTKEIIAVFPSCSFLSFLSHKKLARLRELFFQLNMDRITQEHRNNDCPTRQVAQCTQSLVFSSLPHHIKPCILHTAHCGLLKAAACGHCVCCCTNASPFSVWGTQRIL